MRTAESIYVGFGFIAYCSTSIMNAVGINYRVAFDGRELQYRQHDAFRYVFRPKGMLLNVCTIHTVCTL